MARHTDPTCPPFAYPYAENYWCESSGCWRRRATPEGNRLAAEWVAQHDTPTLVRRCPRTKPMAESYIRRHSRDEFDSLCGLAVTEGVITWRPERGPLRMAVLGSAWSLLTAALGYEHAKRRACPGEVVPLTDEMAQAVGLTDHRHPPAESVAAVPDILAAVRRAVSDYHGPLIDMLAAGLDSEAIGERLGLEMPVVNNRKHRLRLALAGKGITVAALV